MTKGNDKTKSADHAYCIGVALKWVEKKPNYITIPDSLVKANSVHGKKQQWFDYDRKCFYPIGVLDKEGNLAHTKFNVQMEISYQNNNYEPIEAAPVVGPIKATKDGVYWFSSIKSYVFGGIIIKFSAVDENGEGVDCKDFEARIAVTLDEDGNVDPREVKVEHDTARGMEAEVEVEVEAEVEAEESLKKSKKITNRIADEDVLAEVEEEAEDEGKKAKKKRRAGSMGQDIDSDAVGPPDGIEKNIAPVKKGNDSGKLKGGGQETDIYEPDVIMPEPIVAPLAARNRILRWPFLDGSGKSEKIVVSGPVLSVTLPQSLVLAVFDDQCRVRTAAMLAGESQSSNSKTKSDIDSIFYNEILNRPTVNQLFDKLAGRMGHVLEAHDIVFRLRLLFEHVFEDWVLYEEEKRLLLKAKLLQLNTRQVKFADAFGPYYFLRFLVFYATMADYCGESGGSGSSAARGTDRAVKSIFAKAQEVLSNAIKDLDDGAPKYFA